MTATKQPSASSVIAMPEQRVVQVQDLSVRLATSERVVDAVFGSSACPRAEGGDDVQGCVFGDLLTRRGASLPTAP